jgi:hypothetical protein
VVAEVTGRDLELLKKVRAVIERRRQAAVLANQQAQAERRARAIAIADQVVGLVGDNCSPAYLRNVMTVAAAADDAESAAEAVCLFTTRPKFMPSEHGSFAVLPLLEIIPMMTGYELTGLTASIKDHGLRRAIVLNADGTILVDGRCRLMACKAAGVEPQFRHLPEGADLDEWTWDENIRFRVPRGQSVSYDAVARLVCYRDAPDDHWAFAGIPSPVLNAARVVIKDRPDAVHAILHHTTTLDAIFQEIAKQRTRLARERDELDRLWGSSPLIADLVTEGRISLEEAWLLDAKRREQITVEVDPVAEPAPVGTPKRRRRR